MKRVYLDNAASTPMDPEVLEQMIPYFTEIQGNPSSVHHHGRQLRAVIEKARKTVAKVIGAAPGEIFFTSGGTEADNTAICGAVRGSGRKHIVSTRIEHHAVLHTIETLEKNGEVSVSWLNVDGKGNPDLEQLEEVLASQPDALVCLMHGNNEIGTLIDLHKVGGICEKHGALFMSDTVQSMGNVRYNLAETPVHFVTASGHKFYGPKGVGFLYVKSGVQVPPFFQGGSQERNMRPGTENLPAIVGMAHALEKCILNLDIKNEHLWTMKSQMKTLLRSRFPQIVFNGENEPHNSLPTVLNVSFPNQGEDSMLLFNLDIAGISVSGGSACTSGSLKGSHVLHGIGAPPEVASNSVRFSFGWRNTLEEIGYTVGKLESLLSKPVLT